MRPYFVIYVSFFVVFFFVGVCLSVRHMRLALVMWAQWATLFAKFGESYRCLNPNIK